MLVIGKKDKIVIVAGRGNYGSVSDYTGAQDCKTLNDYLTNIRRNTGNWIRAIVYSHKTPNGDLGKDFETEEYLSFPTIKGPFWNNLNAA